MYWNVGLELGGVNQFHICCPALKCDCDECSPSFLANEMSEKLPEQPKRDECVRYGPCVLGDPKWIRTTGLRIRNPALYPAELWGRETGVNP